MEAEVQTYRSRRNNRLIVITLAISTCIVILTLLSALWHSGKFLPPWVDWKSYNAIVDVNGNGHEESVNLTNRHLTITDYEGNHFITPNEWLISDVHIGDITRDSTAEVLVLLWQRDYEPDATFHISALGAIPGFSQHLCLFDYSKGDLDTLWMSAPLRFEAHFASLDETGKLELTLGGGGKTSWEWNDPGFVLQDEDIYGSHTPRMD